MKKSNSFSTSDLEIGRDGLKVVEKAMRKRAQSASNSISGAPFNVIRTDEHGVVFDVSPDFCTFTGYGEEEMIGKKCSFLQGTETDPEDIMQLRLAMKHERQTSVIILNFCKDGTPFWNLLTIIPMFSKETKKLAYYKGEIINFEIPENMRRYPKFCVDDAFALISVFSSIPRMIGEREHNVISTVDRSILDHTSFLEEEEALAEELAAEERPFVAQIPGLGSPSTELPGQDNGTGFYKHQNYAKKFEGADGSPVSGHYMFVAETALPTRLGRFRCRAYRDCVSGAEPLAMIVGNIEGKSDVIVRVHDQCVTSEVFGSFRCDCKEQLDFALSYIQEHEGMVLYLPQEGRGIGIANKINAYAAQERGLDTVEANRFLGLPDDARQYESVRDILTDLKIKSIRLLSNNPRKFNCLEDLGINVSDRLPCVVTPNSEYAMKYVHSKAQKMGHMIDIKSLNSTFQNSLTMPSRPSTAPGGSRPPTDDCESQTPSE